MRNCIDLCIYEIDSCIENKHKIFNYNVECQLTYLNLYNESTIMYKNHDSILYTSAGQVV